MRAALITPTHRGSSSGNSVTAIRWATILQELGWNTSLSTTFNGESTDVMIALNAYRSAESIHRFRERHPERPLIVALTGTDLYRYLDSDPETTRSAIEAADRLVVLNTLAHERLDADQREKCYVILESAKPLPRSRSPFTRHFDVCVVGHLRDEKDPLLTARAVNSLPASSRIRVRHYGRAHTQVWADAAREEMSLNHRYKWFDEVPHWQIRRVLSSSRLMVISSNMEGGPNCLSEAIVAGLPPITTEIDGCVGVLGGSYPGYFPAGDTAALSELLHRAESDEAFLPEMEAAIRVIAHRFTRSRERERWATLLNDVFSSELNGTRSG